MNYKNIQKLRKFRNSKKKKKRRKNRREILGYLWMQSKNTGIQRRIEQGGSDIEIHLNILHWNWALTRCSETYPRRGRGRERGRESFALFLWFDWKTALERERVGKILLKWRLCPKFPAENCEFVGEMTKVTFHDGLAFGWQLDVLARTFHRLVEGTGEPHCSYLSVGALGHF